MLFTVLSEFASFCVSLAVVDNVFTTACDALLVKSSVVPVHNLL